LDYDWIHSFSDYYGGGMEISEQAKKSVSSPIMSRQG